MKWTTTVVAVMLVILCVGSFRWSVSLGNAYRNRVLIARGAVQYSHDPVLANEESRAIEAMSDRYAELEKKLQHLRASGLPSTDQRLLEVENQWYRVEEDIACLPHRWYVQRIPTLYLPGTVADPPSFYLASWYGRRPSVPRGNAPGYSPPIPFWPVSLPFLVISAVLWRRDLIAARLARIGTCSACRYDLRGLAHAVCPECGAPSIAHPTDPTPALIATASPHSGHAASAANPARL